MRKSSRWAGDWRSFPRPGPAASCRDPDRNVLNPQPNVLMKSHPLLLAAATALFALSPLVAQDAAKKDAAPAKKAKAPPLPGAGTGGTTPHATTSTVVGPNRDEGGRVTVTYGRPFLKHPRTGEVRKVWGGLVKWDAADRLGADEATLLVTQRDMVIGTTTVPAGAYTLYIIPSEKGTSRLAFSKHIGKWGVPVDETKDLARFDLKKESLSETVDQLTITVENTPAQSMNGVLKIKWEQTQFSLPFSLKK